MNRCLTNLLLSLLWIVAANLSQAEIIVHEVDNPICDDCLLCVEGAFDFTVGSDMDFDPSCRYIHPNEGQIWSLSFEEVGDGIEMTWILRLADNPDESTPTTDPFQLQIDESFGNLTVDETDGGQFYSSGRRKVLVWQTGKDSYEISGTVRFEARSLPQSLGFRCEGGGTASATFGGGTCDGGEETIPVPSDPPSPPEPCNDEPIAESSSTGGGGGSGQCDDGGGGGGPGTSAFCPPGEVLTLGDRVDFSAADIAGGGAGGGCAGCSGIGSGGSQMSPMNDPNRPVLDVRRTLTPHELSYPSSFGLGWYAETDMGIEFFQASSDDDHASLLFFDPQTERVIELHDGNNNVDGDGADDGTFETYQSNARYFTSLVVKNAAGNPVEDPFGIGSVHGTYTPLNATLTRRNGWVYEFDIVDLGTSGNPKPAGRLTSITSPTGFTKTLAYQFNATEANDLAAIQAIPERQLMLSTITDSYRNVATYSYSPNQIGGRYVVEKIEIDLDFGNAESADLTLIYEYDSSTNRLANVKREIEPENLITTSTYSYATDDAMSADSITWQEERTNGLSKNETAVLSRDAIILDGELVNQFSARLIARKDGTGHAYLKVYRPMEVSAAFPNVYRLLHRGRLMDWSIGHYLKHYKDFQHNIGANPGDPFMDFENLEGEEYFAMNSGSDLELQLGQPSQIRDETGYTIDLTYDDVTGNLLTRDHTNTGGGYERYEYNSNDQLTKYRDREGYVTRYDFATDAETGPGLHLIRIARGLKDNNNSPNLGIVETPQPESTMEVFKFNSSGQVISSASTDYHATELDPPADLKTIYAYDNNGRLDKVIKPRPNGVTNAPDVDYTWVNGKLVVVVDEAENYMAFQYDELDRLEQVDYNGTSTQQTRYDDAENRIITKDRNDRLSYVEYDEAGRMTVRSQYIGLDDNILDDNDSDEGTPLGSIGEFSIFASNFETETSYFYELGKRQPFASKTNGRYVTYTYDYRERSSTSSRQIGSNVADVRKTENQYDRNRLFKTTESFLNGDQSFSRSTYRAYSQDSTNVRIVEVRNDAVTSFDNNEAVMDAPRPSIDDLNNASHNLRVVDRITDRRGASIRYINERGIITDFVVDALGRTKEEKAGLWMAADADVNDPPVTTNQMTTTNNYNFRGQVVSTTSPLGNTTVSTYDPAGNLQTRDVAVGSVSAAVAEAPEMSSQYWYDAKGRQTQHQIPSGGSNWSFYSDCCGRQMGRQNAMGEKSITIQNHGGQVVYQAAVRSNEDIGNDVPYTDLSQFERLTETTRSYDQAGRLQFQTTWKQPLPLPDNSAFDPQNPVIAKGGDLYPQGVTTQYAYLNQIPNGISFLGGGTQASVSIEKLDGTGNFSINLADALTQLSNQGITFTMSRTGSGRIVMAADERSYNFTIQDSLGRTVMTGVSYGPLETSVDHAPNDLINWTITKHDQSGSVSAEPVEIVSTYDVDGYETRTLTNAFGWALESHQIEGASNTYKTSTKYDISGNPLEVTDDNGHIVNYEYDRLGRQISMTRIMAGDDLETSTAYFVGNHSNLVMQRVDSRGHAVNYELTDYDVLGRLLVQRDRMDNELDVLNANTETYDSAGNMINVLDAEGKLTIYDYDLLGRKTLTTYDDDRQVKIGYDDAGRMKFTQIYGPNEDSSDAMEDQEGLRREYFYTHGGVVERIVFSQNDRDDGTTARTYEHTFAYDEFLRRTESYNQSDDVKVTYDYTDRGQLLYEVLDVDAAPDNDLFETVYDYDAKGRVASIQYPAFGTESRTVRYDYTLRGQLDTVHWDNDSENVEIEDRVYDGVGLLTDIDRPHFDENRQYDNANRLEFINNTKTGGDQIGRLDYDYDENGNKTSESFVGGPAALADWDFTIPSYDREDRFTGFVRTSGNIADTSVSLDRSTSAGTIGSIQSVTNNNAGGPGLEAEPRGSRGYSDAHALTTVGVQTQTFNFEGQLVSTHTGNNLTWDLAGRLEQAVAGGDTYHYGYDTDGRRVWKKKENENQFTVYAYGGPNVIAEFDVDEPSGDAVNVHRNVFGTTIDELLLVEKDDGTQYGITRNQQWSVMAAYDFATGDIAKRFNYGVFGNRYMVEPDGTISDDQNDDLGIKLGYTSRRHDDETGLMYFRARYYDPKTGEFISQDPLEYVDGMSLYRGYFVPGATDPSGKVIPIIIVGGAAVVITVEEVLAAAGVATIGACLLDPACTRALQEAMRDFVDTLSEAARNALILGCRALYRLYKSTEANCGSCNPRPATCFVDRIVRCTHATANASCHLAAAGFRGSYIASGCDALIPTTRNHPAAFIQRHNGYLKCQKSAEANCTLSGL